jgi:hypothetical protein
MKHNHKSLYNIGSSVYIDETCKTTFKIYGSTREMKNMLGTIQIIEDIKYDDVNRCYKYFIKRYMWAEEDLLTKDPILNLQINPLISTGIVTFNVDEIV